jgi:hypothetical protein
VIATCNADNKLAFVASKNIPLIRYQRMNGQCSTYNISDSAVVGHVYCTRQTVRGGLPVKGEIQMRKNTKKSSSAGNVANVPVSYAVQRRKRRSLARIHDEGYDEGIRHCVEALLNSGGDRAWIARAFSPVGILFPTSTSFDWNGLFAFDDWDAWVNAEPF